MPEIAETLVQEEAAALRMIEGHAREFIIYVEKYPSRFFAPRTLELVEKIKPQIARLDELRALKAEDQKDQSSKTAV
jgi:hypothetical protein